MSQSNKHTKYFKKCNLSKVIIVILKKRIKYCQISNCQEKQKLSKEK